jgi:hypothetical protein
VFWAVTLCSYVSQYHHILVEKSRNPVLGSWDTREAVDTNFHPNDIKKKKGLESY